MNRFWCQCAVIFLLSFWAADSLAGTGRVISLPLPGKRPSSGLILQIDTRWLDGNGYRPVRVRVSPIPPGPVPADRNLQVTLSPRGWRTGTKQGTVTADLELAQGARVVQETVAVPHRELWASLDVEVREDGAICRDLTENRISLPRRSNHEWTEAVPATLFIDSDAPPWPASAELRQISRQPADGSNSNRLLDVRAIASQLPVTHPAQLPAGGAYEAIDDQEMLAIVRDLPKIEIVPPSELPDRWINLSGVDIAVISEPDLGLLSRSFPRKWEALRAWLETGTILCVVGVELQPGALGELEATFRLKTGQQARGELPGWALPDAGKFADRINELRDVFRGRPMGVPFGVRALGPERRLSGEPQQQGLPQSQRPSHPRPFAWREVGAGQLVAIADEQHFNREPRNWCWLLNSLSSANWMWYQRHGFSMYRENPDYWKLLIPNVGQAPVNTFLLLISLFVVVIGPVNYFLLQRSGRLYLLIVTVPAGAVLISLSLLAYALLTDGLSVRARARSLTQIDQHAGRCVSWSRQTYYAGMAPANGMSFPLDAAVYPVEFRPQNRFLPTDRRWHTRWGAEQRLVAGFLPSRNTTQYLVVQSRPTEARLEIETTRTGALRATNQLGTGIISLLVRDEQGGYRAGKALSEGGSAELVTVKRAEVSPNWKLAIARNRPSYPTGFDPYQMENAAGIFPRAAAVWYTVDRSLPDPTFASSVFEARIRLLSLDLRSLEPQSYLALVESSPELGLGTAAAHEQASFHLVLGSW